MRRTTLEPMSQSEIAVATVVTAATSPTKQVEMRTDNPFRRLIKQSDTHNITFKLRLPGAVLGPGVHHGILDRVSDSNPLFQCGPNSTGNV